MNIFSYLRVTYSFITICTELPSSIGYLFNDESLKILIPGTELEKRFCKQLKKECLSKQGKLLNSDKFWTILLIKISYVFLHLIKLTGSHKSYLIIDLIYALPHNEKIIVKFSAKTRKIGRDQ